MQCCLSAAFKMVQIALLDTRLPPLLPRPCLVACHHRSPGDRALSHAHNQLADQALVGSASIMSLSKMRTPCAACSGIARPNAGLAGTRTASCGENEPLPQQLVRHLCFFSCYNQTCPTLDGMDLAICKKLTWIQITLYPLDTDKTPQSKESPFSWGCSVSKINSLYICLNEKMQAFTWPVDQRPMSIVLVTLGQRMSYFKDIVITQCQRATRQKADGKDAHGQGGWGSFTVQ